LTIQSHRTPAITEAPANIRMNIISMTPVAFFPVMHFPNPVPVIGRQMWEETRYTTMWYEFFIDRYCYFFLVMNELELQMDGRSHHIEKLNLPVVADLYEIPGYSVTRSFPASAYTP